MVELALVLPLLVSLVLGTVDIGRAYRLKASLANAAREGAAFAQANPGRVDGVGICADPDNITFATQNEGGSRTGYAVAVETTTQAVDSPPATWTTLTGCATGGLTARVAVSASAPFTLLTPFLSVLVGRSITLHERAEVAVR